MIGLVHWLAKRLLPDEAWWRWLRWRAERERRQDGWEPPVPHWPTFDPSEMPMPGVSTGIAPVPARRAPRNPSRSDWR